MQYYIHMYIHIYIYYVESYQTIVIVTEECSLIVIKWWSVGSHRLLSIPYRHVRVVGVFLTSDVSIVTNALVSFIKLLTPPMTLLSRIQQKYGNLLKGRYIRTYIDTISVLYHTFMCICIGSYNNMYCHHDYCVKFSMIISYHSITYKNTLSWNNNIRFVMFIICNAYIYIYIYYTAAHKITHIKVVYKNSRNLCYSNILADICVRPKLYL